MEPTKRPLFPIYDIMEHWAAFAHSNPDVKCQHHALYLALVNLCKAKGGSSRFALAYQHGMDISGIGSRNTYAAALKELQGWEFLTHTPGANGYKSPIIDVHFCASAEHLLSIYRASTGTPADTSTGHNKEVISLRLEVVEKATTIKALQDEVADLQDEVSELRQRLDMMPCPLPSEKAKQQTLVAAHTDPDDLQGVEESPLVKPDAFAAILRATGYPNLDAERYRLQIAAKSEGVRRTSSQWRSRIIEFVNNDYTAGKLLTYPVLTPNEIPGNWDTTRQGAYTAPMGQGIPHPSSYLKPDFTPR